MTESRDERRAKPPLEPWALELEGRPADSSSCQELSRVIALLRDLPDPVPPSHLTARILERLAEEPTRPRWLRVIVGDAPITPQRLGLALAAGIAAFAVITALPGPLSVSIGFEPGGVPQAAAPTIASASALGSNRSGRPTTVVRPQFVSIYSPSSGQGPPSALDRTSAHDAFDAQLDRQLNQLMLDPTAFAIRLERMAQRDSFIARLAERAAERGDASEIALSVRHSPHPLARQIMHRMLRATLVHAASR